LGLIISLLFLYGLVRDSVAFNNRVQIIACLMKVSNMSLLTLTTLAMSLVLDLSTIYGPAFQTAYAQASINDPGLKVELVTGSMSFPTSMAFVDDNNILVLEKDGAVRLVSNGVLQDTPVLQVPVESKNERGLLGIATTRSEDNATSSGTGGQPETVFLYFTEQGEEELRNRVYKYQWDGQSLANPTLLLDLPAGPGTNHQGGKMIVGPDGYLYVVTGEMQREGQLQNIINGPAADDTGVILRVNPTDGSPASGNPLSSDPTDPLSKYYAYGIRNSFGIDFDPVTGKLWDAENGEDVFDEINLVEPGLNSGWKAVMGPMAANTGVSESNLVNMPGAQYADPVFSWAESRGISDIEFFDSTILGPSYENGIFVGDITTGTLFYFEPNADRNGLNLENDPLLSDLVADTDDEMSAVTFGTGFTGITEIETGPDGNLYVLSFDREADGQGSLYRIVPTGEADTSSGAIPSVPPTTTVPPVIDGENEDDTVEQDLSEQDDADENNEGDEEN
jgi:glucose/arabinose dehydrogenase